MHSSPPAEPLGFSGQRVFITGGTGFIGRSLLDYLAESALLHAADFSATVLSRDPAGFLRQYPEYSNLPWLAFTAGDLDKLPPANGEGYTDLLHAAADTHRTTDAFGWLDQLVGGTRNVLDFAAKRGVRRTLFVSSGAIYGQQAAEDALLEEDAQQAPLPTDTSAVYAHGKRMAEQLCALYTEQRRLPCVIARCFAVLSRHVPLDGPYASGNFIRDALTQEHIAVRGDGSAVRSYIDGRDMAHWLFTLLRNGAAGQAYNVGSDKALSVLQLAEKIRQLLAPEKPIQVESQRSGGGRSRYLPSIAKARQLGLALDTSLEDSIVAAAAGMRRKLRIR